MKLSFDFKNFNLKSSGSLINKIKSNYSILLWGFLGVIGLLTALVVFREVNKISLVQTDTAGILDKIVRVNLDKHQAIEKQLGENSSFEPQPVPGAGAFGAAPQPEQE